MSARVAVIGAGVAGTAAAYAAAVEGAEVTMVGARPGATALGSGAIDGATARPFGDDRARVLAFFEALELWEIDAEKCRVATCAGLLREARGRDRAVLDLSRAPSGVVVVLDPGRTGWDATSLARAWSAEPWARERGLRFEPARVEALRFAEEASMPDVDLAARHDDPERVRWLAARLAEWPGLTTKTALVMGPWLGLRTHVAQELTRLLSLRVGETLSLPGGVAGVRFELARDALLARAGVRRSKQMAALVRAQGATRVQIELESETIEADAVVLALGGLAAGGVEWAPSRGGHGFELSLESPASFGMGGRPLAASGSPRGPLFEPLAWAGRASSAGFERVGVWTDGDGRARDGEGKPLGWLYAAGDVAADAPRTLLEAIRSGIAVGTLAARQTG
jgi:glycine/D-amino acid oxidase-like deaminating enzyme